MLHSWLKNIQDTFYSPTCLLCGRQTGAKRDICAACERDLPWNRHACQRCAAPLPTDQESRVCGQCLRHPPAWHAAVSPLRYAWPLDQLIQRFKFKADLATGNLLGCLLAGYLAADPAPRPDCLIPVPLHPARLKERGFNQALELARPVGRRLRVPLVPELCRRLRHTEVQSTLDAKSRQRNLQGAFEVFPRVRGLTVAILDDVVTTGATASALCLALHEAGAREVRVWSLARAAG